MWFCSSVQRGCQQRNKTKRVSNTDGRHSRLKPDMATRHKISVYFHLIWPCSHAKWAHEHYYKEMYYSSSCLRSVIKQIMDLWMSIVQWQMWWTISLCPPWAKKGAYLHIFFLKYWDAKEKKKGAKDSGKKKESSRPSAQVRYPTGNGFLCLSCLHWFFWPLVFPSVTLPSHGWMNDWECATFL